MLRPSCDCYVDVCMYIYTYMYIYIYLQVRENAYIGHSENFTATLIHKVELL